MNQSDVKGVKEAVKGLEASLLQINTFMQKAVKEVKDSMTEEQAQELSKSLTQMDEMTAKVNEIKAKFEKFAQ